MVFIVQCEQCKNGLIDCGNIDYDDDDLTKRNCKCSNPNKTIVIVGNLERSNNNHNWTMKYRSNVYVTNYRQHFNNRVAMSSP